MPDTIHPTLRHVTVSFAYDNVEQEHARVSDDLLTLTDAELGYWLRQAIMNTVAEGPLDERVQRIYSDHAEGKHNHCTHIFCRTAKERLQRRDQRLQELLRSVRGPSFVAGQGEITVIAIDL